MKKYIPILEWLPNYRQSYLLGDLSAGFTVGVMLIPQGMAYAMIAGLPPVYGLYAAIAPNIVYAIFGSSRKLAVGPVALDSLIVASGLAAMSLPSVEMYISMALFLALFVGSIQLVLGLLKMGFLADFLSRPVVSGFTAASAIIIGISQLKYVFGIPIDAKNTMQTLTQLVQNFHLLNTSDLLIGAASIAFILASKRLHKKLPAAMLVVLVGILGIFFLAPNTAEISLLGNIPVGLPKFEAHLFYTQRWSQVFPLAMALAFIAFAEAMSMIKAVEDQQNEYYADPNQELRALGMANIIGSFFQSYPANGGLSRTAVNVEEGAKTGLSALVSALVVGLCLLFLTQYFKFLPKAILGAIIIVAVFKLIEIKTPKDLWKSQPEELALYFLTFLTTLFIGISQGIVIGVVLSLLFLVYRTSTPHIAVLGKIPGFDYFKNVNRFENEVEVHPEIFILRFDAQLYFANVNYLTRAIRKRMIDNKGVLKYVILNAESINYIDSTAIKEIERIVVDLKQNQIVFKIAGAIGPLRDIFYRSNLVEVIGQSNIYVRTVEAYEDCLSIKERKPIQSKVSLQHK